MKQKKTTPPVWRVNVACWVGWGVQALAPQTGGSTCVAAHRKHTTSNGRWAVLHMVCLVLLESHQPSPPAPEPSQAKPSPHAGCASCCTRKHGAVQKIHHLSPFSQRLNCPRHSCMFHTHSVITFVLHKGKRTWSKRLLASQLSSTSVSTNAVNLLFYSLLLL